MSMSGAPHGLAPQRGQRFYPPVPAKRGWTDGIRIWWREIDKVLLGLIIALMVVGLVAAAAASPAGAAQAAKHGENLSDFHYLTRTALFQLAGLGGMLAVSFISRDDARRLAIVVAGVMLVLYRPGAVGATPTGLADALALLGGFCFALTNALLRRWRDTPRDARVLAMFAGGLAMSGALVLAGLAGGAPPALSVSWLPWALALTLAFLSGNLALQYGAARLPAQVTALIMLAEVVIAAVSAVLLGAATPTAWTWAGGVLIVSAAVLSIRPGRRPG